MLLVTKKRNVSIFTGKKKTFLDILGPVVLSRRSSAGWMPESMARWSIGVGRRHPVKMRKASCRTLSVVPAAYRNGLNPT